MVKIPFNTFGLALDALGALRKNNIPASYWPQGGDTPTKSFPVIHQIAIEKRYETMARSVLGAL